MRDFLLGAIFALHCVLNSHEIHTNMREDWVNIMGLYDMVGDETLLDEYHRLKQEVAKQVMVAA